MQTAWRTFRAMGKKWFELIEEQRDDGMAPV